MRMVRSRVRLLSEILMKLNMHKLLRLPPNPLRRSKLKNNCKER